MRDAYAREVEFKRSRRRSSRRVAAVGGGLDFYHDMRHHVHSSHVTVRGWRKG